jgi:hypothetical protein
MRRPCSRIVNEAERTEVYSRQSADHEQSYCSNNSKAIFLSVTTACDSCRERCFRRRGCHAPGPSEYNRDSEGGVSNAD